MVNTLALASALAFALSIAGCKDDATAPADAGVEAGELPKPSDLCPDPANARVHYREKDPNACRRLVLDCTTEQNGFDNRCGCGCIDKGSALCPPIEDPAIRFISRDPAECGSELPYCPPEETAFNSTCGCGCTKPGG